MVGIHDPAKATPDRRQVIVNERPYYLFWDSEVYFLLLNVMIVRIRVAKLNVTMNVSKIVTGITPFIVGSCLSNGNDFC